MEAKLYRELYRKVYGVAHPQRRKRELYDDR